MATKKRIEIYQDEHGEFRWRVVSRNGKTMADSGEGYKRRGALIRSLCSLFDLDVTEAELMHVADRMELPGRYA